MFHAPPFPLALARVKGLHHRKNSKPCQDFAAWSYQQNPSSFIVSLADGAGSSEFSEEGAYLSVQRALLFFKNCLKDPLFFQDPNLLKEKARAFIEDLHIFLKAKSLLKKCPLESFATTLLVFIASKEGFVFFQIGDGFGVIRRPDSSEYTLLIPPQKGEYLNETHFITELHAFEKFSFCTEPILPAFLALATDGIESVALKNISFIPYPPFFEPLESFIMCGQENASQRLQEFLSTSRFDNRSLDDRTLFLSTFKEGVFS